MNQGGVAPDSERIKHDAPLDHGAGTGDGASPAMLSAADAADRVQPMRLASEAGRKLCVWRSITARRPAAPLHSGIESIASLTSWSR